MSDTHPAAHLAQIEALRRLGPEGRLTLALRMSDDARRIALDAERRRQPAATELEVRRTVLRRLYGDELMNRAWPERDER